MSERANKWIDGSRWKHMLVACVRRACPKDGDLPSNHLSLRR